MQSKLKIGVFGIGAIGSVISSLLLQQNTFTLYFYTRAPKENIKLIFNKKKSILPINSIQTIQDGVALDWLILCLKEYHFQEASLKFVHLIKPNTRIAIIRNGIRLKESLLKIASEENILACMIDCPTQPVGDNFYMQLRKPIVTMPDADISNSFERLFLGQPIQFNKTQDFKTESWKKLLESSALGAILCLSGETCWIFQDEKLVKIYEELLLEGLAIAQADGAKIDHSYISHLIKKLKSYPDSKGSSMLSDRLKGNPIELGAKNGIISKLAQEYGIKTPINDLICGLLKYTNRKIRT